jgi:predicted ribosome quality control (RQC) complex YloA/Tae2 family protein
MAHLHLAQPGLSQLTVPDFATQKPVTIHLRPDRTLLQNAQSLYKQHQKLKRVQNKVVPLLEELRAEWNYLQAVAASLQQLEGDHQLEDLEALTEIREELIEQGYLANPQPRRRLKPAPFHPCIFLSPSDFEIWIGRNNRQNDYLTFRVAREYDLWFHSQEIPGSHVLLRLPAGAIAEAADLQSAADLSAYFSQARQSEQVPVVYTQPKYVFKPKGARPGMVVYQQETILWGKPANLSLYRRKNYSGAS